MERDRRLFVLLDRLSAVGMTVNGEKCVFGLTVPKFFGHFQAMAFVQVKRKSLLL